MKKQILVGLICLGAVLVPAQESDLNAVKQQLKEATEAFQKAMEQQRQVIESLTKKVNQLEAQQSGVTNQQAELRRLVQATTNAAPVDTGSIAKRGWSPSDPIRLFGSGQNYLNLSFDALFAAGSSTAEDVGRLETGGHDPNQRGFTIQNLETVFEGKVDPYFRGQANIVMSLDADGETIIEAEEAFLETMSLPWNLQVKAGLYLTEFGRLNATHPHTWGFVDQPLVNGRFLGGDGLRNPGARVSWLAPTPFYSEFFLSMQNSGGETASSFRSSGGHAHGDEEEDALPFALRHADNDRGVHSLDDFLFAPRYAASFDLTPAQTLVAGASAAFGPNSSGESGDNKTQIYGLDLTWKWKPVSHSGGFPFVQWQTEAMVQRYEAGGFDWAEDGGDLVDLRTGDAAVLEEETLTDYGVYSQVQYGFRKGWVAGLRADYVWGQRADYEKYQKSYQDGEAFSLDPTREERFRLSPNITWFPTEFSKIRLQYNYDHGRIYGEDHSVWLQWEILLGAHAAHKF